MTAARRIGIIDIGSNSVRLVIYDVTPASAHRVIGEFKQSARLSQKISGDGSLPLAEIADLAGILRQFMLTCEAYGVTTIRAAATAAIRNASNSSDVIRMLYELTGLRIELLSGEDEARVGFIGMASSIDLEEGILVDIGGGSTEVTLFAGRRPVNSVSFPFGAVNTAGRFGNGGNFTPQALQSIRDMVAKAVESQPWIVQSPHLPLVGLGGTFRSLCKINQKRRKYSLPVTHNYTMSVTDMDELMYWLPAFPADKRKKIDGLSKDRFDIIVPGLAIAHTLQQLARSSHYIISGAGLRDGLLAELVFPEQPVPASILERSARNLLLLHDSVSIAHAEQVSHIACSLYDALKPLHQFGSRLRTLLSTTALLYRIGITVSYYQFAKHSSYTIANSRLDGLTHREMLICSLAASFKSRSRTQQQCQPHKDILSAEDVELIVKLGSIVQIAAALDYSETQPITALTSRLDRTGLHIGIQTKQAPDLELREAEALRKDFKKIWGIPFNVEDADPTSMS